MIEFKGVPIPSSIHIMIANTSHRSEGKDRIQKVVQKRNLSDVASPKEDLAYWLSKSPEERIAAVEHLRRQYHASTNRLQRSARVIQRTPS